MELYIIAGPNGAGKTTFAREFLPNYAGCKNFVNACISRKEAHHEGSAFRRNRDAAYTFPH
jgi:predicted ABC-type ATPase